MNNNFTYLLFLIFIINFSCSSNKNFKKRIQKQTIIIDDRLGIISVRFNKKVKNLYDPEIINDRFTYVHKQHRPLGIHITSYRYILVNNKDTMSIDLPMMHYMHNYFFDNIKFKKGNYKIDLDMVVYSKSNNTLDIPIKKGKEIFKHNETLLNTKVIYKPSYEFKGKTVLLKNIDFDYYDLKSDFVIIETKK